jgi:hypothetical protein
MAAVNHDNPLEYSFKFYKDPNFIPLRMFKHLDDHNGKVQLNLSGLLGPIQVGTQAALDSLGLAIGDKETMIRLRRGKVSLQELMLYDFVLEVRRKVPVWRELFHDTPEVMDEVAPHGLTPFDKLTVNSAQLEIHQVATFCHNHELAITVAVATVFYDFDTNYPLAHANVIASKNNVSEEDVLKDAAMALAVKQLIVNSGFIMQNFVDNQASGLALFDYSLLYIHHNTPHQYIDLSLIHGTDTNAPDANVISGKHVKFTNLSDGPVTMSIGTTAGAAPGIKRKVINAHHSASALADDIRNDDGEYLNFHNGNLFDVSGQADISDE